MHDFVMGLKNQATFGAKPKEQESKPAAAPKVDASGFAKPAPKSPHKPQQPSAPAVVNLQAKPGTNPLLPNIPKPDYKKKAIELEQWFMQNPKTAQAAKQEIKE